MLKSNKPESNAPSQPQEFDPSNYSSLEEALIALNSYHHNSSDVPNDPLESLRVDANLCFCKDSKPTIGTTNKVSLNYYRCRIQGEKLYNRILNEQARRRMAFFALVRSIKPKKLAIRSPHINNMLKLYLKSSVKNIDSFLAMKPDLAYASWQDFILSVDMSLFRQHFFPCYCKTKYVNEILLKSPDKKHSRRTGLSSLATFSKFVYTSSHRVRSGVVALTWKDRKTIFYLQLCDQFAEIIARSSPKGFKRYLQTLSDDRTFRFLFGELSKLSIERKDYAFYTCLNRIMTLLRFRRVNPHFKPLKKAYKNLIKNGKKFLSSRIRPKKETKPYWDYEDESESDCQLIEYDSYSQSSEEFSYYYY